MSDGNANLPFKQRLLLEYRSKLTDLAMDFEHLSYCTTSEELNTELSDMFTRIGFIVQGHVGLSSLTLLQYVNHWMKKDHLILVEYRPRVTSFNLINLLRELQNHDADAPMEQVVPMFTAAAASEKQQEIFRLMASFGVRYVIFLTPNAHVEKNLQETLEGLAEYSRMAEEGFDEGSAAVPTVQGERPIPGVEQVEEYAELLADAEELMGAGEYEKAIEIFTRAIESDPNFKSLVRRGDAFYKVSQYVPALNDYRKASSLENSAADPYAKIGSCCFALVKQATAKGDAAKAEKWFQNGKTHLHKAEKIIQTLAKKTGEQPRYGAVMAALAEADFRGLRLDQLQDEVTELTIEVMQQTASIDFTSPGVDVECRLDQAVLLTRSGKYDEAERIFRSVIEKDEEYVAPAFNNFAVELRKSGQYQRAFEIYLELLQHTIPDRDIVIANMKTAGIRHSRQMREATRYDEAEAALKNILMLLERSDGKEWVLCELAMSYLEQQDQAQASFRLMEAFYINPALMSASQFENHYEDLRSLRTEMIKKLTEGHL